MPPQDYFLSDEENERIFREQICPDEFGPAARPHDRRDGTRPLCVLIAGQTGAGKTRTAPQLVEALQRATTAAAPPVHLIADTYKTYHPRYAALAAGAQPGLASPATGHDARRWLARAVGHAGALRRDCVVESACRAPGDFGELAALFRAAAGPGGGRVLVVVLAVHEAQSRLGVLVRYHGGLPEARSRGLPLRLTPRAVHDESYRGLERVAEFIDASDAVDKVVVVRRGNLVGYANARGADGKWLRPPRTAEALEAERCRPGVQAELRAFRTDVETLRREHADQVSGLDEIEALYDTMQSRTAVDGAEDETSTLVPLDCQRFLELD